MSDIAGRNTVARLACLVLAAALLVSAASCSSGGGPKPAATVPQPLATETAVAGGTTSPAPTPAATPRPVPGARDLSPDAQATASEIATRTSDVRGQPFKQPVAMKIISVRDGIEYYRTSFEPQDIADIEAKERLYHLLGLLDEGTNLLNYFLNILSVGITGFYDPDVKTLFLIEEYGAGSQIGRTTTVHEVAHALQDQYFDLNTLDERVRYDWDAKHAYLNVVEGDAVGTEKAFGSGGVRGNISCFAIPRFASGGPGYAILRELNSWYDDGFCFVDAVRDRLPEGITSVFRDLPDSTEQVLHPEKYLAGEAPKPVSIPNLAQSIGAGWKQTYSSTFGEFSLQNLLMLGLGDTAQAMRGADGWGGDRWALYTSEAGAGLAHLHTVWDTEADQRQFWEVLLRSLAVRSGGRVSTDTAQRSVTWNQAGKTLRASTSADGVTILVSTDAAALQAALTALGQ